MKLKVDVGDDRLLEEGGDTATSLVLSDNIVQPTRRSVAAIVQRLGGVGSRNAIDRDLLPENPVAQQALKIIYHASTRRKNPAAIGEFNGEYHGNARKLLTAAQAFLAQMYGGRFAIAGKYVGTERGSWDIIQTPYGEFTQGNWNRTGTEEPYGTVTKIQEGFKVGDTVLCQGEEAVVVDGSHFHGGLADATRTILIRFKNGKAAKVTPWSLKRT